MPYTSHDTAAIRRRIAADLALIVKTVRDGDPGLRSLVLTGGFARGEGTVLDGVPQNDYDLVAIRGLRRPKTSYAAMRTALEQRLGLHIDLAPVPAWRLRWSAPSIFWYETALRGKVLWGRDLLGRIRTRSAADLDAGEGLRLLVNRSAGLLLATEMKDAHAIRIQAAKALLAAFDAHLLAAHRFAPSQRERWHRFQGLRSAGRASPALLAGASWFEWAYDFKLEPAGHPLPDAAQAWQAARHAILAAVPVALAHAGFETLEAYGRQDSLAARLVYRLRAPRVEGARRFASNPTGRVRVATLRLLEAAHDGQVRSGDAARSLAGIARPGPHPLRTLEGLRAATLQ